MIKSQEKAKIVQQKKEEKVKKDEMKRQAEQRSYTTLMQATLSFSRRATF